MSFVYLSPYLAQGHRVLPTTSPSSLAFSDFQMETLSPLVLQANSKLQPLEERIILPPIPFTRPRGWTTIKLVLFLTTTWIELCMLPLSLYYGLHFAAELEDWKTFAIITSLWGTNLYVHLCWHSWKLWRDEFYRPLGVKSRWYLDVTTWTLAVAVVAALSFLIIGTITKNVSIRVVALAPSALMLTVGVIGALITMWSSLGFGAPFRLNGTRRGDLVKPAVYYFVEDIMAVDVNKGWAYREALRARYEASVHFRQMMLTQSLFWSAPLLVLSGCLFAVALTNHVPRVAVYGICESSVPSSKCVGN